MERYNFIHYDLTLSYLDAGGPGQILIALHAHWMEGQTFAPLALALLPEWRVIALDQRGHGNSSHAPSYGREDYLGDLAALYAHLKITSAVMLGNSLGGVNAYQFAARHRESVSGLIIEDIGAIIGDDTSFSLPWSGTFSTRQELEETVSARFVPYLKDSFRQVADGWRWPSTPKTL